MKFGRRCALLGLSSFAAKTAWAQEHWPSRPVRIIVPFPGGAGTDLLARAYADRLSRLWGQPIVVENRTGAGGIIGTEAAFRAPKDGHTILMANAAVLSSGPAINATLPYDPIGGFDPIAVVGTNDSALVVRADSPYRSLSELFAATRARPGVLTYSSAGNGTSTHMAAEYMKQLANVDITHVPYRGTPQALTDMLAGVVDMTMITISSVIATIRNGEGRALATTGAARDPALPDVPTFAEAGLQNYAASAWLGFVVPAGVPPRIVDAMVEGVRQVHSEDGFADRINALGIKPLLITGAEFRVLLVTESARWREVAERAGIRSMQQ